MDGGWSAFGPWVCSCYTSSRFCNILRRRYCRNPVPQNGGKYCQGSSYEKKEEKVEKEQCKKLAFLLNYLESVNGKK